MTIAGQNGSEGNDRLYECLAELLDTDSSVLTPNAVNAASDDPDVAAEVQAYFEAAKEFHQFAARCTRSDDVRRSSPLPDRVGDYELLAEIGRGGGAVVYKARQIRPNRLVAIKMLPAGPAGSLQAVERLQFEAEAVGQLQHFGIVPIYEVGEHDGRPYFSMPLFEGGSLSARLQEFVSQPRRAAEIVESIARAVQHAHERGILHRDLKPSNILLDVHGRPHVADFGLAKRVADGRELTRTGELIGTPAYMAPERVVGSVWAGPTTTATDIYGLGALLYVLLTGCPPFERQTPVETLLAVGTLEVVPPRTLNAAIDRDLETICLKCLEKVPSSRYVTAAEVADDVRRWLDNEPIAARPSAGGEKLRRWIKRHPVLATTAIAIATTLLVGTIGLTASYLAVNRAYHEAESHRQVVASQAARLNQQLYVSQISKAFRHLQRGELLELRSVLDQFRDQPELRGFEWRWLDGQARSMPREVSRFNRHTQIVYGGDLSPHGRTAATCGADGTIWLWDAATGEELQTLANGAGLSPSGVPFDENCVAFSPDGTMLASAGEDGGIRLWNLADGTRQALTPTWPAEARSGFSPDGRLLAACWADGHLQVWDVNTRSLRLELAASSAPLHAVSFTPSVEELVTIDNDGTVAVWGLLTGNQRLRFESRSNPRALTIAPDGSVVAIAGLDDTVYIHQLTDGRCVHRYLSSEGTRSLAYSPDGSLLAAAGNDGCVRIWDTVNRCPVRLFKAHRTIVWGVAFSRDGNRLLTVSSDRTAVVWELGNTEVRTVEHLRLDPLRALTCSSDGQQLASMTNQEVVRVHNAASVSDYSSLPVLAYRECRPVFMRGGRRLAYLDQDFAIRLWDTAKGDFVLPEPIDTEAAGVQLPDTPVRVTVVGDELIAKPVEGPFFSCSGDSWIRASKPDDGAPRRLLCVLGDGRTLVLCRENPAQIECWTIINGLPALRSMFPGRASVAAASADGHWLALGVDEGTIELIAAPGLNSRRTLIGHYEEITSLDFSPDGRTLVSTSKDGTARFWSVATGAELFEIVDGEFPLYSAKFFPDGHTLAIGGDPEENRASLLIFRTE